MEIGQICTFQNTQSKWDGKPLIIVGLGHFDVNARYLSYDDTYHYVGNEIKYMFLNEVK